MGPTSTLGLHGGSAGWQLEKYDHPARKGPAEQYRFYRENSVNGLFSNFFTTDRPLDIGGQTWPTVEHYFQAQKFAYKSDDNSNLSGRKVRIRESIRTAESPAQTKKSLGTTRLI